MYTVEVTKQCGCFTKSGVATAYSYGSLEEAQKKAEALVSEFNENFCGKHKFKLENSGSIIKIVEDEDA